MKSKIFLLGLGAPRCGTTWLFKFLSDYPEVNFGFKKEYHVFDSVYTEQFRYFSARNIRPANNGEPTDFEKKYLNELALLSSMELDHANYFEYFSKLLDDQKIFITGDITPTYCALPKSTLQLIKDNFTKRGIAIKAIFLLRDPVEKICSEARLAIKFKRVRGKKITENISAEEVLKHYLKDELVRSTTEYSEIINKLKSVFAENELYLGLLETMHTKDELNRLCHYLELPPSYHLIETKVNATTNAPDSFIESDLRESIGIAYQKEYDYCQALFPKINLAQFWQTY